MEMEIEIEREGDGLEVLSMERGGGAPRNSRPRRKIGQVFNTNSNSTVIQTSNDTTYQSCSWDDSQDNDTIQYDGGDQQFGKALTIAVPLTIEGPNYYFSDADDSIQCQSGMAFEIQVHYGLGLPPSLNQPPPPPYIEPPGHGFAQSPPITVTPSPGNGGFRAAANVLGVFSVLLHLLPFSILIF